MYTCAKQWPIVVQYHISMLLILLLLLLLTVWIVFRHKHTFCCLRTSTQNLLSILGCCPAQFVFHASFSVFITDTNNNNNNVSLLFRLLVSTNFEHISQLIASYLFKWWVVMNTLSCRYQMRKGKDLLEFEVNTMVPQAHTSNIHLVAKQSFFSVAAYD